MFLITRGFFAANGVPAANRLIDVFDRVDHVTRPSLFDVALLPISNPAETDSLGNLSFYIAAGQYEFHVSGYSIPFDTSEGGGALAPIKFHQAAPAATWTIIHDRNTKPVVLLVADSDGGQPSFTDVSYPDDSTIVVEWPVAESGWAYIQ